MPRRQRKERVPSNNKSPHNLLDRLNANGTLEFAFVL